MPNAGTDIPAAPSLLMAPWLKSLGLAPRADNGLSVRPGVPEPDRGGSLGGRLGGGALVPAEEATTDSYGGGLWLLGRSLLTGGDGRLEVDRPVVSALYGPVGIWCSSSSSS